jgi:hypothetical protein
VLRVEENGREVPWLFFDLRRDPLEQRNLVGDPARAGELAELTRWL